MIGPYVSIDYTDPTDSFRDHDDRFAAVGRRVMALIREQVGADAIEVEHIGSSAIPGCAGKGVVDLMVTYLPGGLGAAKAVIDGVGFQRYQAAGAWGEERPVRIGTIDHDGTTFRLHVHVIAADDPEVVSQRRFRDRLRADPALVAEYVAIKRAVLTAGVTDSRAYNRGKDAFIRSVLDDQPAADLG